MAGQIVVPAAAQQHARQPFNQPTTGPTECEALQVKYSHHSAEGTIPRGSPVGRFVDVGVRLELVSGVGAGGQCHSQARVRLVPDLQL